MQRGQALLQAGGDREGSAQHTELSVLVYHFLKVTWVGVHCGKRQRWICSCMTQPIAAFETHETPREQALCNAPCPLSLISRTLGP